MEMCCHIGWRTVLPNTMESYPNNILLPRYQERESKRERERASERPAKYYPVLIIIIINRPGATTTWLSSECLRGEDIIRMCGLLYVGRRRLASCVVGGVRELGEVFVSVSPGKGATYLQPSSHFRNRHGTHWRSSPAFGPSVLPATLYIFYW